MTEIVGIDLGTTNSLIGIFDAGFPILFSNEAGSRLTPSAVYFPQEGEPVIGAAALRMRSLDPANTIVSVKRLMGSRPGENAHSPANTEAKDARGRLTIEAGGKPRTPVEVSAHILRELKKLAEHSLGHAVERAVITVPAYFNDAQRNATKQAGELAGFRVERILAEPTAAALAYGLDRLKEKARIAVFDLGGGTFDISILEMHDGLFEVISTNGNTRLGGDDMDAALADHLAKELGLEKPSLEIRMRLSEAARSAKEALSENETTTIHLPFLTAGSSSTLTVTRATLEHLCRPIIARTESHCRRSLADAKISTKELDAVILVGGATRMPLVREFVAGLFDRTPDVSQHPDEAVAKGAIIQAGMLEGKLENLTLLDITPLSLGIETFGGLMNVLIPRNSTIPCKAGEMFTNVAANQQSMRLRILQGERELAADNWPLGEMEVPFQPAPKGQARVGVQFEIDANGILHVLARDIATGQDKELTIQSAVDVTDDAVEKMLEDSLEHAFEDMSERIFVEAKIKAEEMLPAVEMGLHHLGHRLSSDEKAKIEQCVEKVRSALLSHETVNLKSALAELDALTQELATLLLEELS